MKAAELALLAAIIFELLANQGASAAPVQCTLFSDNISNEQLNAIIPMLASPSMRSYHRDWHFLRSAWPKLSDSEKAKYLSEGWTPPRDENLLKSSNDSDLESGKSVAGEDFLLMHRKMIEMNQAILVSKHLPCIAGWHPIPVDLAGHTGNGDLWPVPTEQLQPYLWTEEGRQQALARIQAWETQYQDPAWLKAHSLSYVGQTVEVTIHGSMHDLWSGMPPCGADDDRNSPKCNFLENMYESHVNPVFWKLHGWIDSLIDQWVAAHGYHEISEDCGARPNCYQWKASWMGREMM